MSERLPEAVTSQATLSEAAKALLLTDDRSDFAFGDPATEELRAAGLVFYDYTLDDDLTEWPLWTLTEAGERLAQDLGPNP